MIKFNIPYVAVSLMAEGAGIPTKENAPMDDFSDACARQKQELGQDECNAMLAELAGAGHLTIQEKGTVKLSHDMKEVVEALCAPPTCMKLRFCEKDGKEIKYFVPVEDTWMKIEERKGIFYCEGPVPDSIVKYEILGRLAGMEEDPRAAMELQIRTPGQARSTCVSCGAEGYGVVIYTCGELDFIENHEIPKTPEALKEIYCLMFGHDTGEKAPDKEKINWLHVGRGALIAAAVYACVIVFNVVLKSVLM